MKRAWVRLENDETFSSEQRCYGARRPSELNPQLNIFLSGCGHLGSNGLAAELNAALALIGMK